MPSPYKTNCFDYNKIGCKSRRECYDRCNVEWALKHCNSLPTNTILDKNNEINKILKNFNQAHECNEKYNWSDCIDEYYTIKPLSVTQLNTHQDRGLFSLCIHYYNKQNYKNLAENDIKSISIINTQIAFHQTAKSRENCHCHCHCHCQGSYKTDKNCLATIKIAKVAIAVGFQRKQHFVRNLNTVPQRLKCFKWHNKTMWLYLFFDSYFHCNCKMSSS